MCVALTRHARRIQDAIESGADSRTLDPYSWSPANKQLAHQWVAQCLANHQNCNRELREVRWLPTRLIDIGNCDGPKENVSLVERKSTKPRAQYISLSHRWGSSPVLSLRACNESELKKGITIDNLPKTFRHAIDVVREFGIRYIWIDSICIMQDSDEDWQAECSRMGQVYKNAFLNIAATGSYNSHTGLFFERDPSLVSGGTVETQWQGDIPNSKYFFFPTKFWESGVSSAPLNRRAWVVQERLLARRVLHFGVHGLFFECHEHEACEMFPRKLPSLISHDNTINQFKALDPLDGFPLGTRREMHLKWQRIVTAFMRSDLIKETDKMVAISAIADEFQQHIFQYQYIAGLWEEHFKYQLLWQVMKESQANGLPSYRPRPSRAPSWSWLSIDANIFMPQPAEDPCLYQFEIIDLHIELQNKSHPTGQIRAGHMIVRCSLQPVTYKSIPSFSVLVPKYCLLKNGENLRDTLVFFDEVAQKPAEGEVIFCAPVIKEKNFISGLILRPTTREMEYERVGMFKAVNEAEITSLLDGSRDYLTTITFV